MSSKVVGTAETSDAASIRIDSEEKQCVVADEDVEDIVELSTADPTESSTAGPTDIDEMGPPPEMKIPPTADTLDIDEMDPSENVVPATTTGTLLDINEILGPPEKRKPFPGWLANIDEFVNSLIVPDDFILDESGLGLIHIKGIDIKHISVKVLRKICVRFKVSGYRNGKKDSTISLIVRLLKRDWLVGQLYPPTPMITYNEVIGIHNNNRNNDESIIEDEEKSCGNDDMDSDCSQKGKPDEADKDPDYVLNSQNSSEDDDKSLPLPPGTLTIITKLHTGTTKSQEVMMTLLILLEANLIYITTIYGCAKFLTFSISLFHCFQNHHSVKVLIVPNLHPYHQRLLARRLLARRKENVHLPHPICPIIPLLWYKWQMHESVLNE